MWLTSSSIGRKLIMSVTGAFLVLFVTFHALMNGVALFWPAAYNTVCEFLGANWYALVGTLVLAAGVIVHIIFATVLTMQNRKARGNERYAVTARQPQVEWSSKNMYVLGVVVIAFFIVHLAQFWYKMQFAEITGMEVLDNGETVPPAAGTLFLAMAFRQAWTLPVYLIGFIALWFHMTHGFWSMVHTVGWNNNVWMKRIKTIGNTWATVVILLFAVEAVVFTVQANRGVYNECPELQAQYKEMLAGHHAGECVTMCQDACDKPCQDACAKECTGACGDCTGECGENCKGNCGENCKGECGENCTNPDCPNKQAAANETETETNN